MLYFNNSIYCSCSLYYKQQSVFLQCEWRECLSSYSMQGVYTKSLLQFLQILHQPTVLGIANDSKACPYQEMIFLEKQVVESTQQVLRICILIVHVFLTQNTCIFIFKLNLKAFLVSKPNKSETLSLDNKYLQNIFLFPYE